MKTPAEAPEGTGWTASLSGLLLCCCCCSARRENSVLFPPPTDRKQSLTPLSLLTFFHFVCCRACFLLRLLPSLRVHCANAAMLIPDQCAVVELGSAEKEQPSTLPFQPPPFIPLLAASPITPTHPSCAGSRAAPAHLARTPKHQVLLKQLEVQQHSGGFDPHV